VHVKEPQIIAVLKSSVIMYFAGVIITDSLLEILSVYDSWEIEAHFYPLWEKI